MGVLLERVFVQIHTSLTGFVLIIQKLALLEMLQIPSAECCGVLSLSIAMVSSQLTTLIILDARQFINAVNNYSLAVECGYGRWVLERCSETTT